MGMLEDLMKALDRIPIWKRLGEIPPEVDDLKQRIAELETKLGGKWPPDVCKFCGERAARLRQTYGPNDKGNMIAEWLCKRCNNAERRIVKPS